MLARVRCVLRAETYFLQSADQLEPRLFHADYWEILLDQLACTGPIHGQSRRKNFKLKYSDQLFYIGLWTNLTGKIKKSLAGAAAVRANYSAAGDTGPVAQTAG